MDVFKRVPTWDNGFWVYTDFNTHEEFTEFVIPLFKEPGKYEFDETTLEFNAQARKYTELKHFCSAVEGSLDFRRYWDGEKEKCRQGAIYKNKGKTWYLPREYYMWVNFLPINDKMKKKFDFPLVWDTQYHMALYETLAELHYVHAAILKKRQIASSYFHCAKMINLIWFEETPIIKMGSAIKDKINEKGSWKFLDEYKSFLDSQTAWYRPMNPGKILMWQQQIEEEVNGRPSLVGNKGSIQGMTFDKDASAGVGGPCTLFFYEEAGIAPTMDITLEFLFPAMQQGMITTGLFIAAGSVGELDKCKPLEQLIKYPEINSIYAVDSKLLDDKGTPGKTGLFIPEQWSMPPYIDQYGNSLVEEALKALDELYTKWKKELEPAKYQYRISQRPRNIAEAFAFRTISKFPTHLLAAQKRRIEDKDYAYEFLDVERNAEGIASFKNTNKLPITEWPITKNTEDKTGCVVVWERPDANSEWGTYYASIDPVSEGKAECVDNMIYTHFGRKRIGDVEIGDLITSSSGSITSVTGVFPQGIKKLYRVYFSDGHSILVCDEHLWNVKLNGGTKGFMTLSTKDLMDKDKKISYQGTGRNIEKTYIINTFIKDNNGKNKWSIPIINNPISFCTIRHERIQIDPYFLGLLIGDGGLSQRDIRFSSIDQELIEYIKNILPKNTSIKKIKGSGCDYRISIDSGNRNPISSVLKFLGLKGKRSEYKFIPNAYKYSNVEDRIALLQGLMDTDGSCTNHGSEFYSSSKKLAYDVVELVQSLGGIAKIRMKKTTHLDSYIVRVLLPVGICPFKLSRKKVKYRPSKVFSRYITDIKYEKDGNAVCISVDAEDQLYVTEHALVTHNTTTSDSLCSIYIYKNPVEVTKVSKSGTIENYIERDKIVAAWCGRFDDINKTHERLSMMLEIYNAWAIIENNISLFIGYMIGKKRQRYLVPKNQIVFLKDIGSNQNVYQEYGWKNTGTIFKAHLLSYLIEFLKEELDTETKEDGTIVKIMFGVERIPDPMAIVEMEGYDDGVNVDRLVALAALIAFAKLQQANRGYKKRLDDQSDKNLHKSDNLFKLKVNAFTHIGMGRRNSGKRPPRTGYKNLR